MKSQRWRTFVDEIYTKNLHEGSEAAQAEFMTSLINVPDTPYPPDLNERISGNVDFFFRHEIKAIFGYLPHIESIRNHSVKMVTATGTVVSMWRYPVKSMLGEELNSSYVTERGLIGDRAYAVIDQETGKVASAKNPRKWGKLFDFRAVFIDRLQVVENIPPVRITFPDGTHIFSNQDDIDCTLSNVLGRDVRLMSASLEKPSYEEYWPDIEGLAQKEKVTDEAMPPQTFFDISVIHLLTTSTINRLRELYPDGRFEVRRFRPNIVVESASGEKDFIENLWIGKKLAIGDDIVLRVNGPCTRCVMITLPQADLPTDIGILRTVARYNQVNVGVYASVLRGGTIRRRDLVRLEA